MRQFYKSNVVSRLAPEQIERQGHISRLAFETLRQPAEAITFLNTHHAALGGRPIDLAIASPEGLLNVVRALSAMPIAGPSAAEEADASGVSSAKNP
jgi:uncharacterized protein (DUF2384 family)